MGETDATGASQINIPYSVNANATPGPITLILNTAGGQTAINFTVGDATPVISTISITSYDVGAQQSVSLTGAHFGTNCPTFRFPFNLTLSGYSTTNCTDGAVTVSFSPAGTGSGPLSLYGEGYSGTGQGFAPQTSTEQQWAAVTVSAIFAPAPILLQSEPLWFFGIGNVPPTLFTLGNISTYISAPATSGGFYAWSIASSSGAASFANGASQISTTTSSDSVLIYSLSYGITVNDTVITLNWTDTSGAIHLPGTLAMTVDSPYKTLPYSNTGVQNAYICTLPPKPPSPGYATNGGYQVIAYTVLSKFGLALVGQSFNESFSDETNYPPYEDNTWPEFEAVGAVGQNNYNIYQDTYCTAYSPGVISPNPAGAGNGTALVDSAFQQYFMGSAAIGSGVQIQNQTLQRYIDHPFVYNRTSPTRPQ